MGVAPSPATPVMAKACPHHVTFAVGGTGDPDSEFVPGMPAGPRENILYPASLDPVKGVSGGRSIAVGSNELDSRAKQYRAQCPDTHITAQGYSLGAVVVANVCGRWQSDAVMNSNTACTTVGNPVRRQRDGTSGILGQLPQLIPDATVEKLQTEGPIPLTDVCNSNDIICNAPDPVAKPLEFANGMLGYHQGDHGYSQSIPQTAGDYVNYQEPRLHSARQTPSSEDLSAVAVVVAAEIVPAEIVPLLPADSVNDAVVIGSLIGTAVEIGTAWLSR